MNSGCITEPFYVSVSFVLFLFLLPISGEVIQEADAHLQEKQKNTFARGMFIPNAAYFHAATRRPWSGKEKTLRPCKALLLRLPFSYKIDCILPPVARVTKKIEERFIYLFAYFYFFFFSLPEPCLCILTFIRATRRRSSFARADRPDAQRLWWMMWFLTPLASWGSGCVCSRACVNAVLSTELIKISVRFSQGFFLSFFFFSRFYSFTFQAPSPSTPQRPAGTLLLAEICKTLLLRHREGILCLCLMVTLLYADL